MLVLTGTDFPTSASTLAAAVNGGLAMFLDLPGGNVVELAGEYPHFSRAALRLTNCSAAGDRLPPEPRGIGAPVPAFDAGRFEISAQPMRIRGNPLALSLTADNAAFVYDRDAAGRPVLLLRDASNGQLSATIAKTDLESLILSAAREAGAHHGISILEAKLQWTQLDSRSVGIAVAITARKLVKAQITVIGRMNIDDAMKAQLSDLECDGAGMISTLACGVIRPKLHQLEGKSFDLNTLTGGQVRVRDVGITVGETLVVQASFGERIS
jgi:hypothetical protein